MKLILDDILIIIKSSLKTYKAFFLAKVKLSFFITLISSGGLYLLGLKHYIGLSILISLIDLLPIIGSGLILLPWALFALGFSNKKLALGLIFLYMTLTIFKQIFEPIIVGRAIGLRPLYTFLISLASSVFLGPFGVFLGPLIAILINSIYLHKFYKLKK